MDKSTVYLSVFEKLIQL